MACINKNHPDVIAIAKDLKVSNAVAAAKIGLWQLKNTTERFPTSDELSKKITDEVKPEISELFESNPELANEVYEALGFDINSLSYAERAKKYKEFGIKKSDGTEITEQDIKQNPTFYQNNTNQSTETAEEFDTELASKIQSILQELYPEIKLDFTNNPVWEQGDNIFNQEEFNNQINYRLKATEILLSDKAKQVFEKGKKANWDLNKILTELQIPKKQKQLILDLGITDREQLALELASEYSYTVEINTAKGNTKLLDTEFNAAAPEWMHDDFLDRERVEGETNTSYYSNLTVPGGTNYTENEISTPLIKPSIKGHAQFSTDNGIGWFRSDEQVLDGDLIYIPESLGNFNWNNDEIENIEINKGLVDTKGGTSTKTRRILEVQSDLFQKGRDKDNLIATVEKHDFTINGDLYSIDRINKAEDGYDTYLKNGNRITYNEFANANEKYIKETVNEKSNQFLQLLNKDNNWVTFFIKSIIQDSAKRGYEKVLFPKGDTAAKIEGHQTLEEFKNTTNQRIKVLQGELKDLDKVDDSDNNWQKLTYETEEGLLQIIKTNGYEDIEFINYEDGQPDKLTREEHNELISNIESSITPKIETGNPLDLNRKKPKKTKEQLEREINAYKQELADVESGQTQLSSIAKFYEETVTNILKKNGYNPVEFTDEYGNAWNEVTVNQARDLGNVLLQRNEANKIIGQANIKAATVLIDAVNQKQDTLPHEYAHHYIAMFRDSAIVQEAIKKWGSEEALVQSIGEQVVAQKGEALSWWNKFTKWIMDKFNSLSKLQKEELTQILTDAFLTRQNLGSKQDIKGFKEFVSNKNNQSNILLQRNTITTPSQTIQNLLKEYGIGSNIINPNQYTAVQNKVAIYNKQYGDSVIALYKTPIGNWVLSEDKNVNNKLDIQELNSIMTRLSNVFGIKFRYDTTLDAKGALINGIIVINPNKVTFDTPFHELAHIFIETLKYENLEFYNKLMNEAMSSRLGKEIYKSKKAFYYKYAKDNNATNEEAEASVWNEVLVEIIGLEAGKINKLYKNKTSKTLLEKLEQFWEYIAKALSALGLNAITAKQLKAFNINQVAALLTGLDNRNTDFTKLMSNKYALNQIYYQADQEFLDSYTNGVDQLTNRDKELTDSQKQTYKTLLEHQSLVERNDTDYTDENGNPIRKYVVDAGAGNKILLNSITSSLKNDARFSFDGKEIDSKEFIKNTIWGNITDLVLEKLISGVPIQTLSHLSKIDYFNKETGELIQANISDYITQDALNNILIDLNKWVNDQYDKGHLLIPQAKLFNLSAKLSGTSDVLLLKPDGSIKVVDLKTSWYDLSGGVQQSRTNPNNTWEYNRRFKKSSGLVKASKKDTHNAQLTAYSYILQNLGIPISGISILPIYVKEFNNDVSTELYLRKEIEMSEKKELIDFLGLETDNLLTNIKRELSAIQISFDNAKSLVAKLAVEARLNNQKGKAKYYAALLEDLGDVSSISTIVKFVESAHDSILGVKNGWKGYYSVFANLMDELIKLKDNNTELSNIEILELYKKLHGLYNEISPFEINTLVGMQSAFTVLLKEFKINLNSLEVDHPFVKLSNTINALSEMKSLLEPNMQKLTAKILAKPLKDKSNDLDKTFFEKKKKIERLIKKFKLITEGKRFFVGGKKSAELFLRKYKGQLADLYSKYAYDSKTGKIDYEKAIFQEIHNGNYKDIDFLQMGFESAINVNNLTVGSVALILKRINEQNRLLATETQPKYKSIVDEYAQASGKSSDNSANFNNEILEVITEYYNGEKSETLNLVNPFDYNKFKKLESDFWNDLNTNTSLSIKAKNKLISDFYKKYTTNRPKQDIVLHGKVIFEGIDSLLARKKAELSSLEFKYWYDSQHNKQGEPINDLVVPVFNNPKFDNIIKNEALSKYYSYLVSELMISRRNNDTIQSENYKAFRLPTVNISNYDSLSEKGISLEGVTDRIRRIKETLAGNKNFNVGEFGEDLTPEEQADLNKFIKELNELGEFGAEESYDYQSVLPTLYDRGTSMDINDVSKDVANSIFLHRMASAKRKQHLRIKELLDGLPKIMKPGAKTNSLNNTLKSAKSTLLGRNDKETDPAAVNAIVVLKEMIDSVLYFKNKKRYNVIPGVVELNSVVDGLLKFVGSTQMALNPIVAVANHLQGTVSAYIEGAANEIYGQKNVIWADKMMSISGKYDLYSDLLSSDAPKTKIGLLYMLYDPQIGTTFNLIQSKISQSVKKRSASFKSLSVMNEMVESNLAAKHLLAALKFKKVKFTDPVTKEVSEISLWEAYDVSDDTGELIIKEGVDSELYNAQFKDTLDAFQKKLQGIYDTLNNPLASKYAIGRLMLFYRKFMTQGLFRRFQTDQLDVESATNREGFYRTFYRTLLFETKELFNLLTNKESNLEEYEKANIRRYLLEVAQILVVSIVVLLLEMIRRGLKDDDEKRKVDVALLFALRLSNELGIYMNIGDVNNSFFPQVTEMINVVQSPFIAIGTIKKAMKFIEYTTKSTPILWGGDIPRYKRDAYPFEKGDSKAIASLIKLFSLNTKVAILDPSELIKAIKVFRNN